MTRHSSPVALVTGAARGIGKAIATRLAVQGAYVVMVDCAESAGQLAAAELAALDCKVSFIAADVADSSMIEATVNSIDRQHGRLDWLVNNAGLSFFRSINDLGVAEFDHVISVNLRAAFLFAKLSAPLLRRSPTGAIVNISSTRALMSEPGNEAYAASKAGLIGLTHALANSLGPKVRVNAICPGWIDVGKQPEPIRPEDHAQHPVGRVGLPEDIAALASFLLSSEAAFITGQAFVADGGMTKKMFYLE